MVVSSSLSSSDSTGLKMGDAGAKSDVNSSLMLRCLRMGFVGGGRGRDGPAERSRRSSADAGSCSTVSGTGCGFGGGVHSTAVCSGP